MIVVKLKSSSEAKNKLRPIQLARANMEILGNRAASFGWRLWDAVLDVNLRFPELSNEAVGRSINARITRLEKKGMTRRIGLKIADLYYSLAMLSGEKYPGEKIEYLGKAYDWYVKHWGGDPKYKPRMVFILLERADACMEYAERLITDNDLLEMVKMVKLARNSHADLGNGAEAGLLDNLLKNLAWVSSEELNPQSKLRVKMEFLKWKQTSANEPIVKERLEGDICDCIYTAFAEYGGVPDDTVSIHLAIGQLRRALAHYEANRPRSVRLKDVRENLGHLYFAAGRKSAEISQDHWAAAYYSVAEEFYGKANHQAGVKQCKDASARLAQIAPEED